jgi:hypothetical protein
MSQRTAIKPTVIGFFRMALVNGKPQELVEPEFVIMDFCQNHITQWYLRIQNHTQPIRGYFLDSCKPIFSGLGI